MRGLKLVLAAALSCAAAFGADPPGPDMMEPGYEEGVSACFAGWLGGRLVMAGGCNFPENPLAPDSEKRYYKGIYAADGSVAGGLRKIGTLPAAVAYGAAVQTPLGLALVGGMDEGAPSDAVCLLDANGDGVCPQVLPSLPFTLDNMAAAAIGNTVYVAGGNADGVPGNSLLALDLENTSAGWKRLRDFPGNPRTQPVMAAAGGALFLWGGFAPRHNAGGIERQPTLETDGLRYDTANDDWTWVAGPVDENGEPVSLGGGAACTLSDGRIAAAGGVNKDVFLEALRNQAPDYLVHPASWYRFNSLIFVFDPAASSWRIVLEDRDAARAGAAIVAGADNDFLMVGGEVKPRIRTPKTTRYSIGYE